MQRYEIPTHLDVEDKLFAGLSARQLLLLIMGIGLGYSLWQRVHLLLPWLLALLMAALPGLVSLALATVRPSGLPLEHWLLTLLRYLSLPKVYLPDNADQRVWEMDCSPEDLAALEVEWQALRQPTHEPAPEDLDEWSTASRHLPTLLDEHTGRGTRWVSQVPASDLAPDLAGR